MRLAITGASGYIGRRLSAMARQHGASVLELGRSLSTASTSTIRFDLKAGLSEPIPPDVTALVHLAADTTGAEVSEADEIRAAAMLLDAFKPASGRPFVFVSSQAASPEAPTRYGRVKSAIEALVLERGGIVVRAGLVYGHSERGLFGTLCAAVRMSPILPAFWPAPRVQPIHVDDLCTGLLALSSGNAGKSKTFNLAAPDPIRFDQFLRALSHHRLRKRRLFILVPTTVFAGAMRLLGPVLPAARIAADRLLSLSNLRPMPTQDSLAALGIGLRDLDAGMQDRRGSNRRRLAAEGRALMRYACDRSPDWRLMLRYVRLCERLAWSPLPEQATRAAVLRAIDSPLQKQMGRALHWRSVILPRVQVAAAIAEGSVLMNDRFFLCDRLPIVRVIAVFATETGKEALRAIYGASIGAIALHRLRQRPRDFE